ncbi:MAG: NADH-quinone oxidoreductase subunit L [Anaerolineae bacterium]
MFENYEWLLLLFPLVGVIINLFFGRFLGKRLVAIVACGAVGLSFAVALSILWGLIQMPVHLRSFTSTLYTWIALGDFEVKASLLIDPLSILMAAVVTGVSFIIHIYSAGYMAEDERYARYFAFLNLFVLSMLILVMGDNFLMMYIGWEGVGLCSYLLIGFWFFKPSAADAGKKAFIVTRIGDFGFALGVILVFFIFRTLDFGRVFELAPNLLQPAGLAATAITLLLFMGAVGKSAQIPLYVWLPDAMEGPTPVSALIHAATMVTAGVYMVARTHVLFELAPASMLIVAVVGTATAFFAATMALAENDIKRILAYSTISQLGYMFLAVGVGAYASGMFHLTTHAFFKALLFLCAGSVMHALSGELNIWNMGGLKGRLKITYGTFVIGAAALAGFPLLSGFFSKDEILWEAVQHSFLLWLVGLITAFLTAFYIFRLIFVAFWGEGRLKVHVHEKEPFSMTFALIVLAIGAFAGGYIGLPRLSLVEGFLRPVFALEGVEHASGGSIVLEFLLMAVSAAVAIGGIYMAYYMYVLQPALRENLSRSYPLVYNLLYNKYYVDQIYMDYIVRPLWAFASFLAEMVDRFAIDGLVEGVGKTIAWLSDVGRRPQTGFVRNYALSILIGVVFIIGYLILR